MPIPNTKLFLNPTITAAGGYSLLSPMPGDLTATPLGRAGPRSIGSVGDLNGDGIADVLIGAPGQDAGGADGGAAHVVWSKASGASVLLNNVALGTGGFKINRAAAGDHIGQTLAALADQNGDGKSEILLAGTSASGGAGVVDGKASALRSTWLTLRQGLAAMRLQAGRAMARAALSRMRAMSTATGGMTF